MPLPKVGSASPITHHIARSLPNPRCVTEVLEPLQCFSIFTIKKTLPKDALLSCGTLNQLLLLQSTVGMERWKTL